MNIGIIYLVTAEMLKGSSQELLAYLDVIETAEAVRAALEANGHQARTVNICKEGYGGLKAFDAIFNLAEDTPGQEWTVVGVTERLEQMGIIFSGESAETIARCGDKAWAKSLLIKHGLPTPHYQVFRDALDLHTTLSYPLIVKPLFEDGSVGIRDDAVVQDDEALAQGVNEILQVYKQPALVEEYIDGREIYSSVIGSGSALRILPLIETLFTNPLGSPRILSFNAKWVAGSPAGQQVQFGNLAILDPELEAEIKAIAGQVCQVLGCRDYTRVDFRLRDRTPYVLEANPNPCIHPQGSSFIAATKNAGFSYEAIINAIMEETLLRLPAHARFTSSKV